MIIRRRHNGKFTVIGNEPMEDTRLSAEGLGVLCYLRSRPDNWQVIPEQLCKRFDCGRAKMYRILRLLVETGYIVRHQYRDVRRRIFGRIEYTVYDEPPEPCVEIEHTAEPRVGFEHTAEPHAAFEHTENRHALIKTDSQQRLKGTKTDRQQKGPSREGLKDRVFLMRTSGVLS